MSQYLQAVVLPTMVAAALAIGITTRAAPPFNSDPAEEAAILGRLATVEPALGRLALVPEGHADSIHVLLAQDGKIWQESRELSLFALVTQVGRRVKVRYRIENGVRLARMITVEGSLDRLPPE